jgi:hypothetical protein
MKCCVSNNSYKYGNDVKLTLDLSEVMSDKLKHEKDAYLTNKIFSGRKQ